MSTFLPFKTSVTLDSTNYELKSAALVIGSLKRKCRFCKMQQCMLGKSIHIFPYMHQTYCYSNPTAVWFQIVSTPPLTFADEPLLGDGLLAYVATLGLLERLQLEGVCVDTLQLLGLQRDRKRDGDVELKPKETVLGFISDSSGEKGVGGGSGVGVGGSDP